MSSRSRSSLPRLSRPCFDLLLGLAWLTMVAFTGTVAADPYINGTWSAVGAWPIAPIHMILLHTGKVFSYGTGPRTAGQGFSYDVWDPTKGLLDPTAHRVLPTQTATNIFCSGQVNLPDGQVLIMGGSQVFNGLKNAGTHHTQIFNTTGEILYLSNSAMHHARWYPTVTVLANGDIVAQGGSNEFRVPTITPELYSQRTKTWQLLSNATSSDFYASGTRQEGWYYPHAFVSHQSTLVQFLHNSNEIWTLDTSGTGSLKLVGTVPGLNFRKYSPTIMFDQNKILVFHEAQHASVVDIRNPNSPTAVATGSTREQRVWANAVNLPNGEVLVVGGASVEQSLPHAVRYGEIWNPVTGMWRVVGAGEKSRLYHSTALLLPDATVLVGGGGPPGPERNLNAEIYEPPYLFAPDGSYAIRPVIATYFGEATYGQTLHVVLTGTNNKIARVSIIRFGSVTHSFNMEERAMTLKFEMLSELTLRIKFTNNRSYLPPGWYMLFLVNDLGVPSRALTVNLL